MKDFIIQIIVGIILIVVGISNMRGNISLLHSYHRKNVKKEDELPFGKKVGLGSIIIGLTIIIAGIMDLFLNQSFQYIIDLILIIGISLGVIIVAYALFKYNKGIF